MCAFPDDALTLEDMLSRAELDLAESEINKQITGSANDETSHGAE